MKKQILSLAIVVAMFGTLASGCSSAKKTDGSDSSSMMKNTTKMDTSKKMMDTTKKDTGKMDTTKKM
jgi:uncharacterized protein YceK